MIRHILFDLDSTLYPETSGLEASCFDRMRKYLSSWLGLPPEECEALRREGYRRCGTTIEWLVRERGFTAVDDYYAALYPEDEADALSADPELRRFLEALPCPCSVLTNSPRFHAERVIGRLGLDGVFTRVFDIGDSGFRGKPHPQAYTRALEALGLGVEEVVFVDDRPDYVNGFIALGGRGILLDETGARPDYSHARVRSLWEISRFLG